MKTIDIMNQLHTVVCNSTGYWSSDTASGYSQHKLTLRQIINDGYKLKDKIDELRAMVYHSKEQLDFKKNFPCWMTGGTFKMYDLHDSGIETYSNILVIDIDKKDNPDSSLEEIKHKLMELPYVFMASKSISGQGIYICILVKDGRNTKAHYKYLVKLLKSKYNLIVDGQCNNIGRKRFISYDDELLVKDDNEEITPFALMEIEKVDETKQLGLYDYEPKKMNYTDSNTLCRKAIWLLLNHGFSIDNINSNNKYSVWYHVACEFHLFEDGHDMFVTFSQNSTQYKDDLATIDSKWNKAEQPTNVDDVYRKWCGMAKSYFGKDWTKLLNQNTI